MDTTGGSTDFDLQLEHGNDLFSLESSGYFLAFENTGELLLEIDISGGVGDRLIEETTDYLKEKGYQNLAVYYLMILMKIYFF